MSDLALCFTLYIIKDCVFSSAVLHQHKLVCTVQYCQEKKIEATLRANEEVEHYLFQTHHCLPRKSHRKHQNPPGQIMSSAVLTVPCFPSHALPMTLGLLNYLPEC